jgi:N-acetylated-alpha-linked acidic dipeptidase
VDEVKKLGSDRREQIVERNRQIDEGVFAALADPKLVSVPPSREAAPEALDFGPLEKGLTALERTTGAYDKALAAAMENGGAALARASVKRVNDRLVVLERAFLLGDGLPQRAWFKNQIYAPGFYTGYGVKTLPGVREAIEQSQWKLAAEEIAKVGRVLEDAGEAIQGAASELERTAQ